MSVDVTRTQSRARTTTCSHVVQIRSAQAGGEVFGASATMSTACMRGTSAVVSAVATVMITVDAHAPPAVRALVRRRRAIEQSWCSPPCPSIPIQRESSDVTGSPVCTNAWSSSPCSAHVTCRTSDSCTHASTFPTNNSTTANAAVPMCRRVMRGPSHGCDRIAPACL